MRLSSSGSDSNINVIVVERSRHASDQPFTTSERGEAMERRSSVSEKKSQSKRDSSQLDRAHMVIAASKQQTWVPSFVPELSASMVMRLFLISRNSDSSIDSIPSDQDDQLSSSAGHLESASASNPMTSISPHPDTNSLKKPAASSEPQPSSNFLCADKKFEQYYLCNMFIDEEAEEEYLIYLHRNRFRALFLGIFLLMVVVTESIRLYPMFKITTPHDASIQSQQDISLSLVQQVSSTDQILAIFFVGISLLSGLALTVGSHVLGKRVQRHDSHLIVIPRQDLQRNANIQEWLIIGSIIGSSAFLGIYILGEDFCPHVETLRGRLLLCRDSLGFAVVYVIALLSSCCVFASVRFASCFVLNLVVLSVYFVLQVFLSKGELGTTRLADDHHWSWSSVIEARFVVVSCVSLWVLVGHRQNEMEDRREFEYACMLEAISLESKYLRQIVTKRLIASVPTHVARRLLANEKIRDHSKEAVILAFGIPSFSTLCTTSSSSEVVDMLNRLFCLLDQTVSPLNCVAKMQTLGDMYLCVSGVYCNVHCAFYPVCQSLRRSAPVFAPIMRRLAANMQVVTCQLITSSIALHVGPVTAAVFGSTMSYVAVGDGVKDCIELMRSANGQTLRLSSSFEKAMHDAALLSDVVQKTLPNISGTPMAPQDGSRPLDEDEENLFQGLWFRERQQANPGLHVIASKPRDYSMSSKFWILKKFTDPEVENMYCDSINERLHVGLTMEHEELRVVGVSVSRSRSNIHLFIGCACLPMLNILILYIVGETRTIFVPQIHQTTFGIVGIVFWAVASTLALCYGLLEHFSVVSKYFRSVGVRNCRRSVLLVYVILYQIAYWQLTDDSILTNNMMATVFIMIELSFFRPNLAGGLIRGVIIDTILINAPLLVIQIMTSDIDMHEGIISMNDHHYIVAVECYVIGFVSVIYNFVVRFLTDVNLRHCFATRGTLEDETKRMEAQKEILHSFAATIVPEFAAAKFQVFLDQFGSITVKDTVDPWLGSWFATSVMDIPILIVQLCPEKNMFASHSNHNDVTRTKRSLFGALEDGHTKLEQLLRRFDEDICIAKSAGDTIILIGLEKNDEDTRAKHLLDFAVELNQLFHATCDPPKMVLNSGLTVGAVIGSDRLSFELFGEAISTSMELLQAMHAPGIVVTQRFANLHGRAPPMVESITRLRRTSMPHSQSGSLSNDPPTPLSSSNHQSSVANGIRAVVGTSNQLMAVHPVTHAALISKPRGDGGGVGSDSLFSLVTTDEELSNQLPTTKTAITTSLSEFQTLAVQLGYTFSQPAIWRVRGGKSIAVVSVTLSSQSQSHSQCSV